MRSIIAIGLLLVSTGIGFTQGVPVCSPPEITVETRPCGGNAPGHMTSVRVTNSCGCPVMVTIHIDKGGKKSSVLLLKPYETKLDSIRLCEESDETFDRAHSEFNCAEPLPVSPPLPPPPPKPIAAPAAPPPAAPPFAPGSPRVQAPEHLPAPPTPAQRAWPKAAQDQCIKVCGAEGDKKWENSCRTLPTCLVVRSTFSRTWVTRGESITPIGGSANRQNWQNCKRLTDCRNQVAAGVLACRSRCS